MLERSVRKITCVFVFPGGSSGFLDVQLVRLQCDVAELTDSLTSSSVVYGHTIVWANPRRLLGARMMASDGGQRCRAMGNLEFLRATRQSVSRF